MNGREKRRRAIYVPDGTHARAAALCARHGISLQDWLDDLVACAVAVDVQPPAPPKRRSWMGVRKLMLN